MICLVVYSPNAADSWGCTRPKLGAWNFNLLLDMDCRGAKHLSHFSLPSLHKQKGVWGVREPGFGPGILIYNAGLLNGDLGQQSKYQLQTFKGFHFIYLFSLKTLNATQVSENCRIEKVKSNAYNSSSKETANRQNLWTVCLIWLITVLLKLIAIYHIFSVFKIIENIWSVESLLVA